MERARARRGARPRSGARGGQRFALLFHDTHHRAVSDPEAIRRFDLEGYDGVLAFGEALAEVYRRWGWGDRVWVWHEAADTRLFRPPEREGPREGLVWIGNWGDDERSAELESFLLRPARTACLPLDIHGVRYPDHALRTLERSTARATAAGCRTPARRRSSPATSPPSTCRAASTWTCCPASRPSACSRRWPAASPSSPRPGATPRGCSARARTTWWRANEAEMARHMAAIRDDAGLRRTLVANGLAAIRARHSCAHRAEELLGILRGLGVREEETIAG